ncbi:MAG: hypothetical protein NZ455_06590 [Bacteroidia bacterium]|nr:hypothetical protein [Bacteroidia bacterium]MDW8345703.1 hypothetical protein [Bacteroidia bacterium]
MGVSLACARVGLLRTTLTLGATLRCALPYGMLRIPHASCLWMFYLVFRHISALPCLIVIINYLQG